MAITLTKGVTLGSSEQVTNTKLHNLVDQATIDLTSVNQVVAMSSKIFKMAKGADVASATTTTLGEDGNYFDITGTTTITGITAKAAGTMVILQFDGILTFTDGGNLKLAGNMTTSADDTITLICDGTNWHEISRSVN